MGTPRRADDVSFEVIDGRAILVDPDGRELITLNAVGTLVWEAADGQLDEAGLAGRLSSRFPAVPAAQIEADVRQFLGELRQLRLVVD
jgi:hypothetical protein